MTGTFSSFMVLSISTKTCSSEFNLSLVDSSTDFFNSHFLMYFKPLSISYGIPDSTSMFVSRINSRYFVSISTLGSNLESALIKCLVNIATAAAIKLATSFSTAAFPFEVETLIFRGGGAWFSKVSMHVKKSQSLIFSPCPIETTNPVPLRIPLALNLSRIGLKGWPGLTP